MPPNKWTDQAERDLLFAILLSNCEKDDKFIKVKWDETHAKMIELGHTFTKEAVSQRWSKVILKSFKDSHKDKDDADVGTPTSGGAKTPGSKASGPSKRKGKATAVAEDAEDATPSKKAKTAHASKGKNVAVKDEDKDEEEGQEEEEDAVALPDYEDGGEI